ncbi:hypothetical protein GCM10020254_07140 [Streptomyces goshikiensis]
MPSPVAWTAVQMNREVSRPSRPTARNAVKTRAPVPTARAASSLPWSSDFRCRAVRFIQKTIHVTRPTEMIDSPPPSSSCASKVRVEEPNWRAAPKPSERATARPMPSQTGPSLPLLPVFTR